MRTRLVRAVAAVAEAAGTVAAAIAGAARLVAAGFVDLLGLVGFVATIAGVHALWGHGWALLVAGVLLLGAYALAEFILPLRFGRRQRQARED